MKKIHKIWTLVRTYHKWVIPFKLCFLFPLWTRASPLFCYCLDLEKFLLSWRTLCQRNNCFTVSELSRRMFEYLMQLLLSDWLLAEVLICNLLKQKVYIFPAAKLWASWWITGTDFLGQVWVVLWGCWSEAGEAWQVVLDAWPELRHVGLGTSL